MVEKLKKIKEIIVQILCITHADFESPGVIEQWAKQRHYDFSIKRPYLQERLAYDFDFLIVMGGPQSPLKMEKAPYLNQEIALIQQAIADNKPVLGFCLGAQLIGEALGAKTRHSPEKEIGVYPITLTEAGRSDPLLQGLSSSFPVIHWHNDMPGLTKDCTILAYSEGCPRQIIRYNPLVYGFQCHLEITEDGMKTMIDAVPGDLKPSRLTQDADQLMSHNYSSINELMVVILDRLINIYFSN